MTTLDLGIASPPMNQLTAFLLALTLCRNFNRKIRLEIGSLLKREQWDVDTPDTLNNLRDRLITYFNQVDPQSLNRAQQELDSASENHVQVINLLDASYPFVLRQIPDAPLVLFVRMRDGLVAKSQTQPGLGFFPALRENTFSIAVVGSRASTDYGARCARILSRQIVENGGVLVSGLADGIDTQAHRGALEGFAFLARADSCEAKATPSLEKLLTAGIAVLGSGVLSIYPEKNADLAAQLVACNGAIISEYGLFTKPRPYFFPERNRIISGLSDAVVIVEARKRSGALITARLALEQGREVCAMPGSVESHASEGSNQLIKDGAVMVRNFEDIFDALPQLQKKLQKKVQRNREQKQQLPITTKAERHNNVKTRRVSHEEISLALEVFTDTDTGYNEHQVTKQLLRLLEHNGMCHLDALVSDLGLPTHQLTSLLSMLELTDVITAYPGNWYSTRGAVDRRHS